MPYNFQAAEKAFKDDKISRLAEDDDGFRFLSLRSLSRSEYMRELASSCGLDVNDTPAKKLLQALFESSYISTEQIENTINLIYARERRTRKRVEPELLSELYLLQNFDWGSLHQNSLEKTIVDNYIKQIKHYHVLCNRIEEKLYPSVRSYVLCSWYNHWTSIIIEDVFKDHERVLPAIGLIKKVDFFVDRIPFDLKVTYLPEGFIKERRQLASQKPELTLLKKFCRQQNIPFFRLPNARLLEDLWSKVEDHPSEEANKLIATLKKFRNILVDEITSDSTDLKRWLYENQGIRRFDASNRLFLILIKKSNYFESWKLKRARDLLVDVIHEALNDFKCTERDRLQFKWEGETYTTTSKTIILARE